MPVYVDREASKLWRKICAEVAVEVPLLVENWKLILAGLIFQYIHGLAAHGVHYIHRPGPILQDSGYFILPELGEDKAFISLPTTSDSYILFNSASWSKLSLPHGTTLLFQGSKLARLPYPESVLEVLFINFPRGVLYGCGDLIFSSHMIFTLIFVSTYHKYGTKRYIKRFTWLLAVIQSLLIIASRKHYTVDIIVAWYTVNLVVFFIDKKLPELPDRSSTSTSLQLLPLCNRDREGKSKDEHQRLVNGTSGANAN